MARFQNSALTFTGKIKRRPADISFSWTISSSLKNKNLNYYAILKGSVINDVRSKDRPFKSSRREVNKIYDVLFNCYLAAE